MAVVPKDRAWLAFKETRAEIGYKITQQRAAVRFLQDCYPGEWERIQYCGHNPITQAAPEQPGKVLVAAQGCRRIPFCVHCTAVEESRKVAQAINQFRAATPGPRQPGFIHTVHTAHLSDDETGMDARRRVSSQPDKFRKAVFAALQEVHGDGIGACVSYHDFGELWWNKRHPHVDMTLNGWMLDGDKPVRTPRIELRGQGRIKWTGILLSHLHAAFPTIQFSEAQASPKSSFFAGAVFGVGRYYDVLAYQMRELVDFRKIVDYDAKLDALRVMDYKTLKRHAMTTDHFIESLNEYQDRLGGWHKPGKTQRRHAYYGHLGMSRIEETAVLMDSKPREHGKSCPCRNCNSWETIYLKEVEEAARGFKPFGLDRH